MVRKNIANYITCIRIIGSIIVIFLEPFSAAFYIVYTLAGLSDAVDGFVARKLNIQSEFGSKLDGASDLIFYSVLIIKINRALFIATPKLVWYFIAGVLFIRVISYLMVALKAHEFASNHIILNKVSGGMVFLLPYVVNQPWFSYYAYALTIVVIFAALQDFKINLGIAKKKSQ